MEEEGVRTVKGGRTRLDAQRRSARVRFSCQRRRKPSPEPLLPEQDVEPGVLLPRRVLRNLARDQLAYGGASRGRSHASPFAGSWNNLHYQRGDACLRHPDVTLEPQSEVGVWTCLRHAKDPVTGRWEAVKMVCPACLEEGGTHGRDARGADACHRRFQRDLRGFVSQGGRRRRVLEGLEEFAEEDEEDCDEEDDYDEEGGESSKRSLSTSSLEGRSHGRGGGSGSEGDNRVPDRPRDD